MTEVPAGRTPEEVRRALAEQIGSGRLRPGQRLGAERALAAELGVSRATLRQALAVLEEGGVVRRVPGRGGGTFVAKGKIERDLSRIVGVPALLRSQGVVAGTRVLSARLAEADDVTAQALRARPGELVIDLVRIRLADGSPFSLEHAKFPARRFPGLLELPLGGSVYELIEEHFGARPAEAVERIEVAAASADEAAILDVEPGAPLMAITRTTTDPDGEPIEFSRDLFRADRTRIVVRTEALAAPPAPSPAGPGSSSCAPRRRDDQGGMGGGEPLPRGVRGDGSPREEQRGVPGGRPPGPAQRVGRIRFMDRQRVNLDGFAIEDPELGLTALRSPHDPAPSLVVADGRVVELDGVPEAEFDSIDTYIARHGLDLSVAEEAMALSDVAFARLLVDPAVPRGEIIRLSAGATPAKLARVLALLRPPELVMAMTKLRARRTPSNQAHVTNRLDDPLLLAADAATAAAFGFREIETTVPVLGDAPSNAVACLIGAAFGADGVLIQCSVEEAMELELGMRGLTSYAETVSLYGTEQVFTDGDDTPWSKAFLTSAYASRGMKMRVSSGAGAEVLMAGAQGKSMLYLEARCVALARAIGAQGVQNGGIDGASVAAAVPGGLRELMAENVMVMMRNLESCSGNDALMSESDMRRTSRTLPIVLAGSDFAFSGFGSIQRYDNMFGPSNFNAEDIDDFLAMQRDWGIDGGLRTVEAARIGELRREAAQACRAVYAHLGLADFTDEHVELAVDAAGSKDLGETDTLAVLGAAHAIRQRGLTVVDIVAALDECGYSS